jgi:glycine betaine transporter
MLSTGGSEEPKIPVKIFWGVVMGLTAGICLVLGGGGITALQTASIVGALPFTVIMLVMCYSIIRALRTEGLEKLNTVKIFENQDPKAAGVKESKATD